MAHILTIGIATLDIINSVDGYPQEDDEVRASQQDIRRGGNAANSAVILAQLGHSCSWAGNLSDDASADFIAADLHHYGIDTTHSCRITGAKTPTSYITHNRRNGSRTIIHYRDLPEYSLEQFSTIDLSPYDWLHFESRHCHETAAMLHRVRLQQPHLPISIEIEKQRPAIDTLFGLADLLLFSRAFARTSGYVDSAEFLHAMRQQQPETGLVCAWGEAGAWVLPGDQPRASLIPAFPPDRLVDTLAAGDTFNAGVIDARCRGLSLPEAVTAACRLAGRKCGSEGLNFLATDKKKI
jgi:ketohexokinase